MIVTLAKEVEPELSSLGPVDLEYLDLQFHLSHVRRRHDQRVNDGFAVQGGKLSGSIDRSVAAYCARERYAIFLCLYRYAVVGQRLVDLPGQTAYIKI